MRKLNEVFIKTVYDPKIKMFKLRSDGKTDVMKSLKPDLGLRSWNDLSVDDKKNIWKHMERYFFDINKMQYNGLLHDEQCYIFFGDDYQKKIKRNLIELVVFSLNDQYKKEVYAKRYLYNKDINSACLDFYHIFHNNTQDLVFEILSIYAYELHNQSESLFKRFVGYLDTVFTDYSIDMIVAATGFFPRQDQKIAEELYVPVLQFLNDDKRMEVNRDLSDSLSDYHKKDYSGSITKTTSALQAFLQILVKGKTGKGDISNLITDGIKMGLVSDDAFSKTILKNMENFLAQERQKSGDAHPKEVYANEKNARLILNLVMVMMQHFIQSS